MGKRGVGKGAFAVLLTATSISISTRPARAADDEGSDVGRVAAEVGGTLGGAATTLVVAVGVAAVLLSGCEGDFCGAGAGVTIAAVGAGGGLFLIPLGTYLAGNAAGGDGSYWTTFAGNAGGALVGGLLSIPAFNSDQELAGALIISGGVVIGNLMGYEASIWARSRERTNAIRVVPRINAKGSAALVAVEGSF